MDPKQILKFCLENCSLVDKEVLNLFDETQDIDSVKLMIEKIKNHTNQNVITKNIFMKKKRKLTNFFMIFHKKPKKNWKALKLNWD